MKCDTPFWVLPKAAFEKVPVPCGRCPPCKLRRVNSWAYRLYQQQKISDYSHFITLTYNTNTVPISHNGFMTLVKKDIQNFFKRLRKNTQNTNIKYYACGEYGTKNNRPHYHAIVFNVQNEQDFADAWTLEGNMIGSIHIGKVESDSIAYTLKYIDKSTYIKKHSRDDRISEFSLMSKNIGVNYLTDEIIQYHKNDMRRLFITKEGGHKIALPRYYRQKIYNDDEQRQQRIYIQTAFEQKEQEQKIQFEHTYGLIEGFDYTKWVENQKYGRVTKFESSLKTRSL
jgi:hypothetical protein